MKLYEMINRDNWIQKALHAGDRHCIAGHARALEWPLQRYELLDEATLALFPERVDAACPDGWRPYVQFNDHPDTTIDDVLRVLKFADV